MDTDALKNPLATASRLRQQKMELLAEILALTHQALLMPDLERLDVLLDQKQAVIGQLQQVDEALKALGAQATPKGVDPVGAEIQRLIEVIVENESALEARLQSERDEVAKALRETERETRIKQYLEPGKGQGPGWNVIE